MASPRTPEGREIPKSTPSAPKRCRDMVLDLMRQFAGMKVEGVKLPGMKLKRHVLTARRTLQLKQSTSANGMVAGLRQMSLAPARGEKRPCEEPSPFMSAGKKRKL